MRRLAAPFKATTGTSDTIYRKLELYWKLLAGFYQHDLDVVVRYRGAPVNNILKLDSTNRINCESIALWAPLIKDVQAHLLKWRQIITCQKRDLDTLCKSDFASPREQVLFTNYSPMGSLYPSPTHVLLQDGFLGYSDYNKSWAVMELENGACYTVTSLRAGTFLGIVPGVVRYGGVMPTEAIQGPNGFWLEVKTSGPLGLISLGLIDEANILYGWQAHADGQVLRYKSCRVLVFSSRPVRALQKLVRFGG